MPESRRRSLRALRGRPGEQRAYRLASSVRLPWAVGLAVLVLLGIAIATLLGRQSSAPATVPRAVLDGQRLLVTAAAQNLRRSLNESVTDLQSFAAVSRSFLDGPSAAGGRVSGADQLTAALEAFQAEHARYIGIALLDAGGRERFATGRPVFAELLAGGFAAPGFREARGRPGERPIIQEGVPVAINPLGIGAVLARYDPTFLRFPVAVAEPGSAWIVDPRGRVVGGLDEATLQPLDRPPLRAAAARGARGLTGAIVTGGDVDRQTVVAYAPVAGVGPAADLGWSVVTSRGVTSFALPQNDIRRQALLAGLSLVTLSLLVFGWIYIMLLRPVIRLQAEAERIAHGDLGRAVEVIRYDEIGIIARSLERIRVLLIRRRVEPEKSPPA